MAKTIVICCSGSFYEHANQVAEKLGSMNYHAVVPATAAQMKLSGDYDISKVKTWYQNAKDKNIKVDKMQAHFKEVAGGDAILLINDDKPGKPAYLGPNSLMEWGVAAYLDKPVFILNSVPKDALYWEEALTATVLEGDLSRMKL